MYDSQKGEDSFLGSPGFVRIGILPHQVILLNEGQTPDVSVPCLMYRDVWMSMWHSSFVLVCGIVRRFPVDTSWQSSRSCPGEGW